MGGTCGKRLTFCLATLRPYALTNYPPSFLISASRKPPLQDWIASLAVMIIEKKMTKWRLHNRRRQQAARHENGMASQLH